MERTYVFNQEPSSGGGNKFDIMAMLPNLMGGKGVDPNLMALLSQGRNNQDQWAFLSLGRSLASCHTELMYQLAPSAKARFTSLTSA